jgi:hypothetical protein
MNGDIKSYAEYNSDDPIRAKTRSYHCKLLGLTSSSNTDVAWNCAQHVLDQMWTAGNEVSADECRTIYGCRACGHLLHPGWQGTSLRVARSEPTKSKTLRRRQQRQRKKLAIFKLKDARDVNRPKNEKPKETSSTKEARVVLLHDDPNLVLDRHHVAIRCGRCQSKVRLKGLKPDKPNRPSMDAHRKRKMEHSAPTSKHRYEEPPCIQEPNDFVRLPPASKQSTNSLLAPPGRKKKKKPEPKPNKLLSFLNSLND